jgi:hypothetical protein
MADPISTANYRWATSQELDTLNKSVSESKNPLPEGTRVSEAWVKDEPDKPVSIISVGTATGKVMVSDGDTQRNLPASTRTNISATGQIPRPVETLISPVSPSVQQSDGNVKYITGYYALRRDVVVSNTPVMMSLSPQEIAERNLTLVSVGEVATESGKVIKATDAEPSSLIHFTQEVNKGVSEYQTKKKQYESDVALIEKFQTNKPLTAQEGARLSVLSAISGEAEYKEKMQTPSFTSFFTQGTTEPIGVSPSIIKPGIELSTPGIIKPKPLTAEEMWISKQESKMQDLQSVPLIGSVISASKGSSEWYSGLVDTHINSKYEENEQLARGLVEAPALLTFGLPYAIASTTFTALGTIENPTIGVPLVAGSIMENKYRFAGQVIGSFVIGGYVARKFSYATLKPTESSITGEIIGYNIKKRVAYVKTETGIRVPSTFFRKESVFKAQGYAEVPIEPIKIKTLSGTKEIQTSLGKEIIVSEKAYLSKTPKQLSKEVSEFSTYSESLDITPEMQYYELLPTEGKTTYVRSPDLTYRLGSFKDYVGGDFGYTTISDIPVAGYSKLVLPESVWLQRSKSVGGTIYERIHFGTDAVKQQSIGLVADITKQFETRIGINVPETTRLYIGEGITFGGELPVRYKSTMVLKDLTKSAKDITQDLGFKKQFPDVSKSDVSPIKSLSETQKTIVYTQVAKKVMSMPTPSFKSMGGSDLGLPMVQLKSIERSETKLTPSGSISMPRSNMPISGAITISPPEVETKRFKGFATPQPQINVGKTESTPIQVQLRPLKQFTEPTPRQIEVERVIPALDLPQIQLEGDFEFKPPKVPEIVPPSITPPPTIPPLPPFGLPSTGSGFGSFGKARTKPVKQRWKDLLSIQKAEAKMDLSKPIEVKSVKSKKKFEIFGMDSYGKDNILDFNKKKKKK